MTYEEALERIKEGDPFSEIYNAEWEEAKQKAKEAIEKQIPKQPKIDRITYVNGQAYFDELNCPTCNNLLIQRDDSGVYFAGRRNRFCEVCGQKLAWGNEK